MKTYKIIISALSQEIFEVEANSEDEARSKVFNMLIAKKINTQFKVA